MGVAMQTQTNTTHYDRSNPSRFAWGMTPLELVLPREFESRIPIYETGGFPANL